MTPAIAEHSRTLIREYLERQRQCGEYDLVQLLVEQQVYDWAGDSMLALFQKHFIVQHSLYELRHYFSTRRLRLQITPVEIALQAEIEPSSSAPATAAERRVAGFYADLANFYAATPDTVVQHLERFWQRVKKTEAGHTAYATLNLNGDEPWPEVQSRFRELAAKTHPDKGGDAQEFASIKAAYDALKASR